MWCSVHLRASVAPSQQGCTIAPATLAVIHRQLIRLTLFDANHVRRKIVITFFEMFHFSVLLLQTSSHRLHDSNISIIIFVFLFNRPNEAAKNRLPEYLRDSALSIGALGDILNRSRLLVINSRDAVARWGLCDCYNL